MKKKSISILAIIAATAIVLAGCGSSAGSKEAVQNSEVGSNKQNSSTTETKVVVEAASADLNYDFANVIGCTYDDVVAELGNPSSDDTESEYHMLTYDDTVFAISKDDECLYAVSKVGEIWNTNISAVKPEEFVSLLGIDKKDIIDDATGDKYNPLGITANKIIAFESDGYEFAIALDDDGEISIDSKAMISMIADEEDIADETN